MTSQKGRDAQRARWARMTPEERAAFVSRRAEALRKALERQRINRMKEAKA